MECAAVSPLKRPGPNSSALYRLTMDAPPHNLRPRYNVCPTDPVDVVSGEANAIWSRCVGALSRSGGANPSRMRDGYLQRPR